MLSIVRDIRSLIIFCGIVGYGFIFGQEPSKTVEKAQMELQEMTPNMMVTDVNKTVDFYEKVLGFKLVNSVPEKGSFDWAYVKRDNVGLMFQQKNNIIEEYPSLKGRDVGGALTFFIEMVGVHDFYIKIKEKVTIVRDLQPKPYTSAEFAIQDCNGYILTFAESDD